MQFLCTFRKTWWLRVLKTFLNEQIGCDCFFEEIKAIGFGKKQQILTEIQKKHEKIQNLKILCNFCVILENLGDLDLQRRSIRNKLVVRKAF